MFSIREEECWKSVKGWVVLKVTTVGTEQAVMPDPWSCENQPLTHPGQIRSYTSVH